MQKKYLIFEIDCSLTKISDSNEKDSNPYFLNV